MTKKIRIIIADDHLLIAETWATLINMDPEFEVIKVYDNTKSLIDEITDIKPDIAILDIKMPTMDGIDAAKLISTEAIAPVLLLTAYSQRDLVERARDAGAVADHITRNGAADGFGTVVHQAGIQSAEAQSCAVGQGNLLTLEA